MKYKTYILLPMVLNLFDAVINKTTSNATGNDLSGEMKTFYSDYLIDMAEPEQIERLKAYVEAKGYDYYSICAPIQEGTRELMNAVWNRLQTLPPVKEYKPEEIPTELLVQNSTGFTITNPEPGYYLVEAPWFPKVLKGIDVEDYEALQYMQRVLEKSGVFEALRQRGIQEGDIVSLYDIEFEYIP